MTFLRWALCLAVGIALCFALWRPSDGGGFAAGLEGRLLDARFLLRGNLPAPKHVAILGIDDATLANAKTFPLPRASIAAAVQAAQAQDATVVALDLLFPEHSSGDAALAEALENHGNSILAISFLEPTDARQLDDLEAALVRSAPTTVRNPPPGRVLSSLNPVQELLDGSHLGHVNVARDTDGALRRVRLLMEARPGLVTPALPLQAARMFIGEDLNAAWGQTISLGSQSLPINETNEAVVNFLGPTGTVPTFSLHKVAEADIAGRIVFIGATARGYGDRFATPFSREMPGVEILAQLSSNIIAGQLLRRDDVTWGIDVILSVIVATTATFAAALRLPLLASLATLGLWSIALIGLQIAFHQFLWLDTTTLLVALTVGSLSGATVRFLQQRKATANLAQYHSPVLQSVLAQQARPGFDGRVQQAAVLFVDVANYTSRTEAIGLAATTDFLRRFHGIVETAATAQKGLVEQYAGDGAMICFGLPDPSPEDPANALACAEALFTAVADMNLDLQRVDQPPVEIRIGLHIGEASAAIVGGANQGHVTFVGDVVNTASRLQDVAKSLGAELVVSAEAVNAIGDVSAHHLQAGGLVPVRGRAAPIEVWMRPNKQTLPSTKG